MIVQRYGHDESGEVKIKRTIMMLYRAHVLLKILEPTRSQEKAWILHCTNILE